MSRISEPLDDVLDEWGGTQDAVDVLTKWRSELDESLREARRMLRVSQRESRIQKSYKETAQERFHRQMEQS